MKNKQAVAASIVRSGHPVDALAGDYTYVKASDTAALIRATLAEVFPDVQFWVRTHRGSSVEVYFDGGCCPPTLLGDVNKVLQPFHGRGFDGMTDSSYTNYAWLRPDGTVTYAGHGWHYGADAEELPSPDLDAVKVVFSQFVFVNNHKPWNASK